MPYRFAARRLRFHLSTAVVLALTAGLLLGLNLSERSTGPKLTWWQSNDGSTTYIGRAFGWPLVCFEEVYLLDTGELMQDGWLQGWELAGDLLAAALILAAVAWTSERWIAWRYRRSNLHDVQMDRNDRR